MPELPEVETIRQHLSQNLKDQPQIKALYFYRKNLRSALPLKLKLNDQHFLSVNRRAKFLFFETEKLILISHLGMSGYWRFEKQFEKRKHDHIAFELSDGRFLIYHDPRRFGLFEQSLKGEEHNNRWIKNLGVEPLSSDWTGEHLFKKSRGKKVAIKTFLLNQQVVSGLGNIYVCEALFMAQIKPTKNVSRLTRAEAERIVTSAKQVLKEAITLGGTTLKDYLRPDGEKGEFKNRLRVYGREGSPCLKCESLILRKTQAARSTFYCKRCQT